MAGGRESEGSSAVAAKWVVLWNLPPGTDVEEWERWYWEHHVPVARRLPGLKRYTATRTVRIAHGSGYYRMAEQYFGSLEALEAAIASPEGHAVAEHAEPYGTDLVLLVSEEEEVAL